MSGAPAGSIPAEAAPDGPATWPWHLLLAPIPPILAFVHDNKLVADWTYATWSVQATWAAELGVALALYPVIRRVRPAALLASVAAILFYSHDALDAWEDPAWWVWIAAIGLFRWKAWPMVGWTRFFNLAMLFTVAQSAWVAYQDVSEPFKPRPKPDRFDTLQVEVKPGPRPDVYYIVLDGYGRADRIEALFGYASPLGDALRARGFVVADAANANYAQTALSFAATLNLRMVGDQLTDVDTNSKNRRALAALCQDNLVSRTFGAAGYRRVAYAGEYTFTEQAGAEVRGPWLRFSEFEYMLVNETPVQTWTKRLGYPQSYLAHQVRRAHLNWVLDHLGTDENDGPTFTFAHIVAPHPPFTFNADGSYRPERTRAAFADGSMWLKIAKKYEETYAEGYVEQLRWLDARIPQVVDEILTHAPDAIIIIQGDHGSGSELDFTDIDKTNVHERLGILAAYRLPNPNAVHPGFSPVNTFRVVFNELFGADLPLLPDRSFFSTWSKPYRTIEVTKTLTEPMARKPIPYADDPAPAVTPAATPAAVPAPRDEPPPGSR